MKQPPEQFTIFAYGTLKRGFSLHGAYCAGAVSIRRAHIRGRLFRGPEGYPFLKIPEEDILAPGTADPVADAALQARMTRDALQRPVTIRVKDSLAGGWMLIRGELMTFNDPRIRLPLLDQLEEFHPGVPSLYRRVIAPAREGRGTSVPAWVYICGPLAARLQKIGANEWLPG